MSVSEDGIGSENSEPKYKFIAILIGEDWAVYEEY